MRDLETQERGEPLIHDPQAASAIIARLGEQVDVLNATILRLVRLLDPDQLRAFTTGREPPRGDHH